MPFPSRAGLRCVPSSGGGSGAGAPVAIGWGAGRNLSAGFG